LRARSTAESALKRSLQPQLLQIEWGSSAVEAKFVGLSFAAGR